MLILLLKTRHKYDCHDYLSRINRSVSSSRVVDKALMDYVLLPRRMRGRLLDVKVWRGEGGGIV